MKTIITAAIAIICIVAGAAGGHFLKTGGGGGSAEAAVANVSTSASDDDHGDASHDDGHAVAEDSHDSGGGHSNGGHGGSYGSGSSDGANYFRFSREFVIPLMRNERVASLVILNISLETDASVAEELFSKEPKLRDNIMTTLVHLSNDGSTLSALTSVDNYEKVRAMILTNLENVVPHGIQNVLILDAAKQDL